MLEIDEDSFEHEVLQASRSLPVVVDFWAPWCGPCRALGPLLEQLERGYAGRFKLVKVNADINPQLAARFQVRSIPYVLVFLDTAAVDGFVGALPEQQLRAFLDRVVPPPSELERRRARELAERGDGAAATAALRSALLLDPSNANAQLDLAELLLADAAPVPEAVRLDEAERALAAARGLLRDEARFRALETRLSSLRSSATLPDLDELRQRVSADPADLSARLALAQRYIAVRCFEPALEELLEILRCRRGPQVEVARRIILDVFELAADQSELVTRYRRQLAAAINR
jgi:putative thioredoxin